MHFVLFHSERAPRSWLRLRSIMAIYNLQQHHKDILYLTSHFIQNCQLNVLGNGCLLLTEWKFKAGCFGQNCVFNMMLAARPSKNTTCTTFNFKHKLTFFKCTDCWHFCWKLWIWQKLQWLLHAGIINQNISCTIVVNNWSCCGQITRPSKKFHWCQSEKFPYL